ncbi:MAG: BREX system Lon protease-like protein BrxL [Actinomycetes bacterium]
MDRIDDIVTEELEGLVVRKDLADKFRGRFSVPTYVGEFLIGKYCATSDEEEIQEGLEQVESLLSRRVVRTGDHELFKAKAREEGSIQIIDLIRVRLDHVKGNDEYIAELPSLQLNDVRIPTRLAVENDRVFTGGFYAQIGITYVSGENRPFLITEVRPIQAHARAGLDRLGEARELLTTQEWKDFLLRSVGLEPAALTVDAQNAYFLRMVPFVVRNYNMVELGPRGTGKSHLFQQISPYAYLLSGGQTTVSQLFVNNASGRRGLVTQHDVVAFDEIAGIRFKDKDGINVMKGYMASGEFARGRESIRAEGGMAFLGNFDVDVHDQLSRGHLLAPMPEDIRDDTAFMDRLHSYVPGWDIPAVGANQKTDHYGLVSDLLAQWWHELRAENRYVGLRSRLQFNDSWRGRDSEAVTRTLDGLIKLLYPDPEAEVAREDLEWAMELATIARRRVKEAQATIGVAEFGAIDLGYRIDGGPLHVPVCPEQIIISPSDFPELGPQVPDLASGLPSSLPTPLPPGFALGDWGTVVDHPVGAEGAFGSVYRISRGFDGRLLAGKLFDPGQRGLSSAEAQHFIRKEVLALERVSHPNIVRTLGPIPVTSTGVWMIVSEWIDGPSLAEFTWQGRFMSGRNIFSAGKQLLSALSYLEREGLVHRDIKPNNIMLTGDNALKLIDFNLMRTEGHQTQYMAGTPRYSPPDIPMDVITSDLDRYAAGVTLYELILHEHPYRDYVARDGLIPPDAQPIDPVTIIGAIDPDLAAFLVRAVAVRTSNRFGSTAEMTADWDRLQVAVEEL